MTISSWLSRPISHSHARHAKRPNSAARLKKARLVLEQLESRVTPSFGLSTLGIFNGANGANPVAGLIMDGSGNLYGTTGNGGANGYGTVFEVAKGSGTITTLASFNGTNGAYPEAGLIMDSSGNLYGTTESGDTINVGCCITYGTIFELANGSSTITTLASFNGANGQWPAAALIMDSSGNLYGTTDVGGASSDGTVFELAKGSSTITALASFNGTDGANPHGALIMNSSGNLYGTAPGGGANGDGTVFELAQGSSTITALASFNGTDGVNPYGALIMNNSGNLYGTAEWGGASDYGTVFELAQGSSTITSLASFNGTNGANPQGALIMDTSGNLYGTTVGGGANSCGTVFELAKGSKTLTALTSFTSSTGESPLPGLSMDSSGNLYGTTEYGGGSDDGTVFELLPHTPALSWSTPAAINYGTALSSTQLDASAADSVTGAAVAGTFVYTPAAGTILQAGSAGPIADQTLSVTFTPANATAYSPITTRVAIDVSQATPVLTWNAPAPITYGTPLSSTQLDATAANPNNGSAVSGTFVYTPPAGTVLLRGSTTLNVTFSPTDTTDYRTTAQATVTLVVTPSYSVSTLATFGAFPNGTDPVGGVIMDSSGNLYGTTAGGGANRDGTVFELAQGSGTITTLATFNGTNGMTPYASLIMDSSGNLYGTTFSGGSSWNGTTNDGYGTVFELAKGSGTITTLVSFTGANGNGAYPRGGVIMDSSGNLYGTTEESRGGYGEVFELAHGSGTITSVNLNRGEDPQGGLVMDSSGNLYGTTAGGAAIVATVFELAHGSRNITLLAELNNPIGADLYDSLIMDSSGNLYGTAAEGGAYHDGTVFELAHGAHEITALASFNGTNGSAPYGGLIMDSSGNLFGTTYTGGASSDGTVFELAQGSGTITTLVSFNGTNGENPEDALIMDSSGNLYGTTNGGGASKDGTVFELTGADSQPALQISDVRSSTGAGASRTFTVTVPNAVGTTDNGYAGMADFTSSDRTASLAANDTAAEIGTDPFVGLVPQKKGKASITDTLFSSTTDGLSADGS